MNNERLEHLIDVMQRVIDYKLPFDMSRWVENLDDVHNCGTAACMGGWACRDDSFSRQGLYLNEDGDPEFKGYNNFIALNKFFDLTSMEGHYLFDSDWSDDPKAAIRRICDVMEGNLRDEQ